MKKIRHYLAAPIWALQWKLWNLAFWVEGHSRVDR